MTQPPMPPILRFNDNQTERWQCCAGDILLWLGWRDLFNATSRLDLAGLWAMLDGDTVTLTNQWDDLPAWFTLHYTEVAGTLVRKFISKYQQGPGPEKPMRSFLKEIRNGRVR